MENLKSFFGFISEFTSEESSEEEVKMPISPVKSKEEERREQHIKQKQVAKNAFKAITLQYKYRFSRTCAYRLNAMVYCLQTGFKTCSNKSLFERWAFEVMPGCLKSLKKIERRKPWQDRNENIIFNWKAQLFETKPESVAHIVNLLEKNEITRPTAEGILKKLISGTTNLQIQAYAENQAKPATQEEVRTQVELFMKNIDFYCLRERIEKLIFRYFFSTSKPERHFPRIYKDIRSIVKKNNVVTIIQNQEQEKFCELSKKMQLASQYYKTSPEGIQNLLFECLKLNQTPIPANIFRFDFNGCSRGKMNFFCQPIMEALQFRTTGHCIMKTFEEVAMEKEIAGNN